MYEEGYQSSKQQSYKSSSIFLNEVLEIIQAKNKKNEYKGYLLY